jgi:hypothetical protein
MLKNLFSYTFSSFKMTGGFEKTAKRKLKISFDAMICWLVDLLILLKKNDNIFDYLNFYNYIIKKFENKYKNNINKYKYK